MYTLNTYHAHFLSMTLHWAFRKKSDAGLNAIHAEKDGKFANSLLRRAGGRAYRSFYFDFQGFFLGRRIRIVMLIGI